MDELMGRNEYARHRGCTPKAVDNAEEDGRIKAAVVREENGKFVGINWQLADQLWARNTDLDQAIRGNGGVLPAGPRELLAPADKPAREEQGEDADGDAGAATKRTRDDELRGELLESKLRQQRADTELRELELAERRGELVSVDEQRKVSARRYRAIRDQVLGIPDRLAWLSREDRLKLAVELKRVLHELSLDAQADADTGDEPAGGTEERVAA
jgi:hypothetical protein